MMPKFTIPELSQADYLRFRALILAKSGLFFHEQKRVELSLGLHKALAAEEQPLTLDQYYTLLTKTDTPDGQAAFNRLVNLLTIGETYFFRDEAQFDALLNHVLPSIIQRKRVQADKLGVRPQLRLWSAGCATGEEPYSLAMLLHQLLPDLDQWHILILASDVNTRVLQQAQQAVYTEWSFRERRALNLRPRYFVERETKYHLIEPIRELVTFTYLNLIDDSYPSAKNNTFSMDVILCRNVTIYFNEETTQQVINKFYDALTSEGWLVTGHSEASLTLYNAFQLRRFRNTSLYQKSQPTVEIAPRKRPAPPVKLPSFTPPPPVVPKPLPPQPLPDQTKPYSLTEGVLDRDSLNQAVQQLEVRVKQHPQDGPSHSLLGRLYADKGMLRQAKHYTQRAIKLDPLLIEPYITLASIYQQENDLQMAITQLKKAAYLDNTSPVLYFNLAMLYHKTNQMRQARRTFEIVIKLLEKLSPTETIQTDVSTQQTTTDLLNISRRMVRQLG